MYKFLAFLTRKAGTTKEQFKDYYENVHSKMGWKYLPPYGTKYERRYITPVRHPMKTDQPPHPAFDCVVEEWFESEEAYKKFLETVASPEIQKEIIDDEAAFVDRDRTFTFLVEDHLSWGPPEPAPPGMYKQMSFVRRKPGMSKEAFKEYYENVHSMFGEKFLPPLCKKYLRRYLTPVRNPNKPGQLPHPDFDCVVEFWYDSEADFRTFTESVNNNPELFKDIVADEEAFVDRPNTFRWLLDDHFSWGPKEPGKVLVPRPWKSERRPDGKQPGS